ncbi:MAG: dihydrodipicolinate synthase family protein [Anaerolineae bacterium]|nr:dihydrodipicolinate synthase family protein [Anaerolineae bacterium]
MVPTISNGVWPTMITPFTADDRLDDSALAAMVDWYSVRGVAGLFAVCQSSEMFHLNLAERVSLARKVVELVAGRVGVIASGHISDKLTAQIDEVTQIAETGVDAVVLVTNRFAREGESDEIWKRNVERFLTAMPADVALGFYECPHPYKRLLNPDLLAWCAATGRFIFLKDTCCDLGQIEAKLAVAGPIKLFNANAATLLRSLEAGAAGYSGVMGNFHSQLYVWLCRHWHRDTAAARRLQAFLGVSSAIEARAYPVCAKYHLQLEGLPLALHTRTRPASDLIDSFRREVVQLRQLTAEYGETYAR